MNSSLAVKTRRLRKEYDDVVALKGLDLEVPAGEIFGLIGPNGAGKSTLLKILATALRPDFGSAEVAGTDVESAPLQARRRVGFMPDFFALYEAVTAEDFLTYFALAFGVARKAVPGRVEGLLAAVNLVEKRRARIGELSRGMKQRLVMAKTLVHDPAVLLLDEPLSGLDPKARMEMREILRGLRAKGKTVVISSHVLAELTGFCTSVGILEKGVLRVSGVMDEVQAKAGGTRRVIIDVDVNAARAREILGRMEGVFLVPGEGETIIFSLTSGRAAIADINRTLVSAGVGVISIREEKNDLEDIYFRLSSHEVQ